nr:hypothetical protein [Limosilactobacillus reuteri]
MPQLINRQRSLLEKELKYLQQRLTLVFSNKDTIKKNYGHYLILTRAISRTKGQIAWLKEIGE